MCVCVCVCSPAERAASKSVNVRYVDVCASVRLRGRVCIRVSERERGAGDSENMHARTQVGGERTAARCRSPDFAKRASKHLRLTRRRREPSTAKRLLKSFRVVEHPTHVRYPTNIPLRDITVERFRALEHAQHGRRPAYIPLRDVAIERFRAGNISTMRLVSAEQITQVRHAGHVPVPDRTVRTLLALAAELQAFFNGV